MQSIYRVRLHGKACELAIEGAYEQTKYIGLIVGLFDPFVWEIPELCVITQWPFKIIFYLDDGKLSLIFVASSSCLLMNFKFF
jgi:hypothetical protein